MEGWSIGEVARRAGVAVDTVRFYERRGLLPAAPRTRAGYRQYSPEAVRRLRFVQRAKALGFSLAEIRELLDDSRRPGSECAAVRARAETKIADVEAKLRDLAAIRDALRQLADACGRGERAAECPILASLGDETNPAIP